MTGPNQFNWTVLDKSINDAIRRNNHVIWRLFIHYPGDPVLRLPRFLINSGVRLVNTTSGISPDYNDPKLLQAIEQFIAAFGKRYDGAKGLGFIQMGLLGFWGEWHTHEAFGILSDETIDKAVSWYRAAFKVTQLQARFPFASSYAAKIGLHDDSFAYSTLDGPDNGNVTVGWFFWPKVTRAGQTDFWKRSVMGGETHPEVQAEVFKPTYAAGTPYKQYFMKCVNVTHATYMIHHHAFKDGGLTGVELQNAQNAHASMGYNFQVTKVAVAKSSSSRVMVDVTLNQVGVAPFYYPLNMTLSCSGAKVSVSGVESLIEFGSSNKFSFPNIPSSSKCMKSVTFTLESSFVLPGRPIRFAQGNGRVSLSLPRPR
jgi:hypothetical protein